MLSRFNIAVHKHPVFLYELYYDQENHINRNDLEIQWKSAILDNLSVFTTNRVKADNYMIAETDGGLKSGFGKKMSLLLHIQHHGANGIMRRINEKYKDQLSLTPSEKNDSQQGKETILKWRDEELNILSSQHELDIEPIDYDALNSSLTFRKQSEKLFKSAIVLDNYRIVPYPSANSETTIIVFKQPAKNKDKAEDKWRIISKHKDDYEALIALKKTVISLKSSVWKVKVSTLWKLLLKPAFGSKQYGFTLLMNAARYN